MYELPFFMLLVPLSPRQKFMSTELDEPLMQLACCPIEPVGCQGVYVERHETSAYFGYELSPRPKEVILTFAR